MTIHLQFKSKASLKTTLLAFLLVFAFSCKDDKPVDDVCEKSEY